MLHFQIATPEKVVYKEEIESVSLPTELGNITLLENHAPLVSSLVPGEMVIRKDGKELTYSVSGGFVEVRPQSRVIVLADAAEHAAEIDEQRAAEAVERARKLMHKEFADDIKFAEASALLERSLTRLRVARKHHTRHNIETDGLPR